MGCSSGTSSLNESKIDITKIQLSNEELNKKFKEAKLCLHEIDLIKKYLINIRVELIYETGACCIKEPNLENIITSFFWYLAYKSKGNISQYQIYFNQGEEPFFSVSTKENDILNISKKINDYLKYLYSYQNNIDNIKNEFEKIYSDFINNWDKYIESIGIKESLNFVLKFSVVEQVQNEEIFKIIDNLYSKDLTFFEKLPELTKDDSYYKQINEIGGNSVVNLHKNVYEIVYNNTSKEKRYLNKPIDGRNEYNNKKIMIKKGLMNYKGIF